MTLASIDPGRSCGVALFVSASPIVAKFKDPTSAEVLAFCRWLEANGFTTLLVEDQHLPRPRIEKGAVKWPVNWPALQKLILNADRWIISGEISGLEVERAKPAEWQGPMLKPAPKEIDGKKRNTKQRSKHVVSATWQTIRRWEPQPLVDSKGRVKREAQLPTDAKPVESSTIPHDICDAALMGLWHRRGRR